MEAYAISRQKVPDAAGSWNDQQEKAVRMTTHNNLHVQY